MRAVVDTIAGQPASRNGEKKKKQTDDAEVLDLSEFGAAVAADAAQRAALAGPAPAPPEPFRSVVSETRHKNTSKLVVCMQIIASRTGTFQPLYEPDAILLLDDAFTDPAIPKSALAGTDYSEIFSLLTMSSFLRTPIMSAFHSVLTTIEHTRRAMGRTHIGFWDLLDGVHLLNFTKWVAGHYLTSLQLANGWQTRWQCTMATAEETNVALRHFQYWEGSARDGHVELPISSHGAWL